MSLLETFIGGFGNGIGYLSALVVWEIYLKDHVHKTIKKKVSISTPTEMTELSPLRPR